VATVVTFTDYRPVRREDGLPWTQAEIRVQPGVTLAMAGPWTVIDTIDLSLPALGGLDTDPRNPQARSFTTEHGIDGDAWYQVQFLDATGDGSFTDPVFQRAAREVLVSPQDVRDHLPTRRVDDSVIAGFIDRATDEMTGRFGPITSGARGLFRQAIEIRAALRTERRVVPEQIGEEGMSPYLSLERELNDLLRALDGLTAGDAGTGGTGGGSTGTDATGKSTFAIV
jgi:hypothetical protein